MSFLHALVDLFLHLDRYLHVLIAEYGVWTYVLLFLVIFCETGLVVTPFLPGDSLLFAAGALAATGALDVHLLAGLLVVAAILGDAFNYTVGRWLGRSVVAARPRWLRQDHLHRTQSFYDRHGGMTIILARFLPIVRTFAPFVAGVAPMPYRRFFLFNVVGGLVWVVLFLYGGYTFGGLSVVRDNFSLVILAIIGVSILPVAVEWLRSRHLRSRSVDLG